MASSLWRFLRVPGRSGSAILLISVTQGLLFLAFRTDPTMVFMIPGHFRDRNSEEFGGSGVSVHTF